MATNYYKICPKCGDKLDTKEGWKEHKEEHIKEEQEERRQLNIPKLLYDYLSEKKRCGESYASTIWRLIDRNQTRSDLEYELLRFDGGIEDE